MLAERAAADRARQEEAGEIPELIALDVEPLAPVRGVTLLGALTVRTAIKTVIRVQSRAAELFLLYTGQTPEDLRIYLSRPLAEIRAARAAAAGPAATPAAGPTGAAQVENLTRLATMLEAGLLTRAEFDTLKASLLGPS